MPLALLLAAVLILAGAGAVQAKVYLTQPQAMARAFGSRRLERKTVFLTPDQTARIAALARVKPDTRIVTYYVARSSAGVTGIAFFDRRQVRTLPVVFMAVVKPSGVLDRVEIMSFDEPDQYFPPPRWLALFDKRPLNDDLALGRGIPHITGASLTSQAMTDGLRLILATFQVAVKGTL